MKTISELAEIIKSNPGCVVTVDNDYWRLDKMNIWDNPHDEEGNPDEFALWEKENTLIDSDQIENASVGDVTQNCYGGGILMALAQINGITIESV